MIAFITFIGVALILAVEGRLLCALIFRLCHATGKSINGLSKAQMWALGFPLGAFLNVLLFFACTVFGIPLLTSVIFLGHLVILLVLGMCAGKTMQPYDECINFNVPCPGFILSRWCKTAFCIFIILSISIKLFYGISEALMPTYYYDSVSQWTMRSKISYEDNAIAFDQNEERGLSKPQYPILLHSLQIVFMLPQKEWNDFVANSSNLLLTLSSLLAIFLMLIRLRGPTVALITISIILMIPLLSEHLRQGHGDIHVLEYMLLSALLFAMFVREKSCAAGLLMLSSLLIAASAWVKQEGLMFGVLPWIITIGIFMCMNRNQIKKIIIYGVLPSIFFGFMWVIFLLVKGLPLSPHGAGDISIIWHSEAVYPALKGLFASGSFGIHWYAVLLFLPFTIYAIIGKWKEYAPELLIILWGLIAFFEALFIYLFTPNVQYLLNGQTFSRTFLLPLAILILGLSLAVSRKQRVTLSEQ